MTDSISQSNASHCKSDFFCYVPTPQATGTYLDSPGRSIDFCLDLDKIRFPLAAGMIIRLTYAITAHDTLTANFTSSGHINLPFRKDRNGLSLLIPPRKGILY